MEPEFEFDFELHLCAPAATSEVFKVQNCHLLVQGLQTFFVKGHVVSVITTQICLCCARVIIDNIETNG